MQSKNSGTFEGKKIYLKKSLTFLLQQAIQLYACTIIMQCTHVDVCKNTICSFDSDTMQIS